jgi:hypothetical protein
MLRPVYHLRQFSKYSLIQIIYKSKVVPVLK